MTEKDFFFSLTLYCVGIIGSFFMYCVREKKKKKKMCAASGYFNQKAIAYKSNTSYARYR